MRGATDLEREGSARTSAGPITIRSAGDPATADVVKAVAKRR
jgi:pyridoxal biosynthesis lyase PdxS